MLFLTISLKGHEGNSQPTCQKKHINLDVSNLTVRFLDRKIEKEESQNGLDSFISDMSGDDSGAITVREKRNRLEY